MIDMILPSLKVNIITPETQFSEPGFSEILDLMNKLQLTFSYFTLYSDLIN